jgi:hypothetical protein
MLEGEGDVFQFHQMQVFNNESHEGDLTNWKSGTVSSPKLASLN